MNPGSTRPVRSMFAGGATVPPSSRSASTAGAHGRAVGRMYLDLRQMQLLETGQADSDRTTAIGMNGIGMNGIPNSRIRVGCERLPEQWRSPTSRACECLGKLDTSSLLTLVLEAGVGDVRLVDPGFCSRCPVGGGAEPPGGPARAETGALLAEMGLASRAPALERVDAIPGARDDSEARRRERRSFFKRVVRPGGVVATRYREESTRRAATLSALGRLARMFDVQLPGRFSSRVCDRCGDEFSGEVEYLCAACRKDVGLFKNMAWSQEVSS